jgi:hypothetical protein
MLSARRSSGDPLLARVGCEVVPEGSWEVTVVLRKGEKITSPELE